MKTLTYLFVGLFIMIAIPLGMIYQAFGIGFMAGKLIVNNLPEKD